jgi:hypothetical protein
LAYEERYESNAPDDEYELKREYERYDVSGFKWKEWLEDKKGNLKKISFESGTYPVQEEWRDAVVKTQNSLIRSSIRKVR